MFLKGLSVLQAKVWLSHGNKNAGNTSYSAGSTEDISISPEGIMALWSNNGAENGISYASGANVGFLSQPVTVSGEAPPHIIASTHELDNLKVGESVTASITYTLTNGTFANPISFVSFLAYGLPSGLTSGMPTRTSDTVITIPITGAPTTVQDGGIVARYNSIPSS